ncbi:MAG: hypothetical protein PHR44_04005 [Candidatus Omnitrophica bacterium]|nr:hypothetical protein [Candidatus Omnitrophota bacterium]
MKNKPNPIPLAMVLCDMVIDDRKTGKKSLVGIFSNINATKVPCIHPRLNVFISLTEGNGEYAGKLKCLYVDKDKTVAELAGPILFQSPHQIIDFNFELCGLPLVAFGNYRFDFYCNEELVISRKFTVSQRKTDVQREE